ncbi:O-antigen ligase family protein [Rhodopila sp.]|uniref:O-antigen ligase family protein n=1 Tax=Rhodopila sp. TaxID=2480087 RepID=UPI002CBEE109|nr:O-antigen ligase family protein [Rhodopila sp.]HVZ09944.1 O-antigen ligase family protein [Rhodopila sp.]
MSESLRVPPSTTVIGLKTVGIGCIMLLPLLLLHARGVGEAVIAIADLCFLGWCALEADWRWLRTPWVWVAGAWWLWLVVCSLPLPWFHLGEGSLHSTVQALAVVRFLLLAAAAEHLFLRPEPVRTWLFVLSVLAVLWIALNSLIQMITGRNIIGWPRGPDGELTGPFGTPRAGPALSRLLLPALLPPVAELLDTRGLIQKVAAYVLLFIGFATMILIGQRMPLVLTLFGLVIVALLMRQLRPVVLAVALAGAVLLAASPVVAPQAYHRLVQSFSSQLEHFSTSSYGMMYARAWEIGRQNPISGLGYDGFGTGCAQPRYFRPTFDGSIPDGGGAAFCWHHPHNYYFEALVDGGFVGLGLFCAMVLAWMITLGRGLWRNPVPIRVALFATAAFEFWPIQSSTSLVSMPIGGWLFLMLGWGLAEARWPRQHPMVDMVDPSPDPPMPARPW